MRAKILNASAGAGKTYQLAYHYIRDVVDQPTIYRHILAVTFTNKATEEMKSRILKEIHTLAEGGRSSYLVLLCRDLHLTEEVIAKRAREARSKILHDYSRFTVLTIDTFFQRILRAFIKELNLDLNYNIEMETASVLAKGTDALIEEITTNHELLRWMTRFVEERIEEGRTWDVREGILSLGEEIFKEGNREALRLSKSREELGRLVNEATERARAAHQELQATALQALEYIAQAGASIDDFPYKAQGFASWFYRLAEGDILPYGARVVKACEEDAAWGKAGTPSQQLRSTLQPLLRALREGYDSSVRQWNTVALLRETFRSFALLNDLYEKVQQHCDEEQLMLLSETKNLLGEFISEQDAPFIYEKVGNRYDRFLIDEFQDTSAKEWANFLPLVQNAMSQTEKCAVLLVGDIKQSIYRWRGSDWKILHEGARKALGTADTEVVHLEENWRSLRAIVHFNNALFTALTALDNEQLNREVGEAFRRGDISRALAEELHDTLHKAYRQVAQRPRRTAEHEGYISLESFVDEPPIVERICQLIDLGYRPAEILILARKAADGARIAATLLDFKRRNSNPRYRFDVMTQEALIIGAAPVNTFLTAALRLALNPNEAMARALYNQYLERPFDAPLSEEERRFFHTLRLISPEEAFERIILYHNLQERTEETAYIQALHEQIIAYCNHHVADIALFLAWWDEQGAQRSLSVEQRQSTIEITTIHKAKGLEKPVVIIPYCSWALNPKSSGVVDNIVWAKAERGEAAALGAVPLRFKKQLASSEFAPAYYRELVYSHVDNINLLYVALTRAAESLHIFYPADSTSHVGALMRRVITVDKKGGCNIGEVVGRHTTDAQTERFEFGCCRGPVERKESPEVTTCLLEEYPTAEADLRLRFPSQRYFEGEEQAELTPRNFGILMHRAFAEATTREEITTAISRMQHEGVISDDEAVELRRLIDEALTLPEAHSWFDGSWEMVRNEQEIILPGAYTSRRPDRVMIRGREAVVVDYKFGERNAKVYERQISAYCDLLRQMGYSEVSGYLWYVKLGKIEPVV